MGFVITKKVHSTNYGYLDQLTLDEENQFLISEFLLIFFKVFEKTVSQLQSLTPH